MSETKNTLKRISFYYLLLMINTIFCANIIADIFPTRNLSTIYLLTLSVCLVLYYFHRVSPTGGLSKAMKTISIMGFLLILFRGIKYSVFAEVGVVDRFVWYLYYAPILLLALFLFYISLNVDSKKNKKINIVWYIILAFTIILIVLILTNDLHQQVFKFDNNFANWDNNYSHGWLFYITYGYVFALYIVSIIILTIKCRVTKSKKNAWIILIPFVIGIVMYLLLFSGKMPAINGINIVEFPEAHIFTTVVVLECCIGLGLIPTNTDYRKIFKNLSISTQITDKEGNSVYISSSAKPVTNTEFSLKSGSRINKHTILNKMEILGGFGFWQDDVTEIDKLNEELKEIKENLEQEVIKELLKEY